MAYTTVTAVREDTGFSDDSKISDEKIQEAIDEAAITIDGSVAHVYTLPFASTPVELQYLNTELAIALLYANEYGEESQDTDKGWRRRVDYVMEQLDRIQDKKLKLIKSDGTEFATNTLSTMSYSPTAASSAAGENDEPRMTFQKQF